MRTKRCNRMKIIWHKIIGGFDIGFNISQHNERRRFNIYLGFWRLIITWEIRKKHES